MKSYIEFIGTAGSGKTEATRILVAHAQQDGMAWIYRVPFRRQLFLKVCLGLLLPLSLFQFSFWPLYFLRIRKAYGATPHIHKIMWNLIFRTAVDAVVVRYLLFSKDSTLVNDESLVGKVAALMVLTHLDVDQAIKVIKSILPSSAILVFIKTAPSTAMAREERREISLPFFDDMDPALKHRFHSDSIAIHELLFERLRALSMSKSFRIQNNGTYSELVTEVTHLHKVLKEDKST